MEFLLTALIVVAGWVGYQAGKKSGGDEVEARYRRSDLADKSQIEESFTRGKLLRIGDMGYMDYARVTEATPPVILVSVTSVAAAQALERSGGLERDDSGFNGEAGYDEWYATLINQWLDNRPNLDPDKRARLYSELVG